MKPMGSSACTLTCLLSDACVYQPTTKRFDNHREKVLKRIVKYQFLGYLSYTHSFHLDSPAVTVILG